MEDKDDAPTPQSRPQDTNETVVRFMGRLVPARLVENLPESIRTLQLNNAMVYCFPSHRHRSLARYTFATSAHILQHHRLIHRGEELVAPLLPDENAKTAQLKRPTGTHHHSHHEKNWNQSTSNSKWRSSCRYTIGVALTFLLGGSEAKVITPELKVTKTSSPLNRNDFPQDPLIAYQQLLDRAVSNDDPVLATVLSEINTIISEQLDSAEQALSIDDTATARKTLSSVTIPESVLFAAHQRRHNEIRNQLNRWQPPQNTEAVPQPPRIEVETANKPPASMSEDVVVTSVSTADLSSETLVTRRRMPKSPYQAWNLIKMPLRIIRFACSFYVK